MPAVPNNHHIPAVNAHRSGSEIYERMGGLRNSGLCDTLARRVETSAIPCQRVNV